jgi:hypothetical protein
VSTTLAATFANSFPSVFDTIAAGVNDIGGKEWE